MGVVNVRRHVVAVVVLLGAAAVQAECRFTGRGTFTAGLEALSRGDLDTAATAFEALVREQPDCAEAHNNLAAVLVEQGHLADAAAELRQALRVQPDYQRARLNLTRVEALLAAQPPPAAPKATLEVEAAVVPPPQPAGAEATTAEARVAEAHATQAQAEELRAAAARAAEAQAAEANAAAARATHAQAEEDLRAAAARAAEAQAAEAKAAEARAAQTKADEAQRAAAAAQPAKPAAIVTLAPEGATACVLNASQRRICVYRRRADAIVQDHCYPISRTQVDTWPHWLAASNITGQRMHLVDESGERRLKVASESYAFGGDVARLRDADFESLVGKVKQWRTPWLVDNDGARVATPTDVTALQAALEGWRQAWEQKRFGDYTAFYGTAFVPQGERDLERWRSRKRALFEQGGTVSVEVTALSILLVDTGAGAVTSFEQAYRSGASTARSFKVLRWQRQGERWVISAETVLWEDGRGGGG